MNRITWSLLAVGGLSLGLVLGRTLRTRTVTSDVPASKVASSKPSVQRPPEIAGQKVFREYRTRSGEWQRDPVGLRKEMERQSTVRLRELVSTFGVETNGKLFSPAGTAPYAVMSAALNELHRREGLAAVEWVASWSGGAERKTALNEILNIAARENPFGAKEWHDRHVAEYGRSNIDQFYTFAIAGAKERGADELIKVEELFSQREERKASTLQGDYSDDFDFGKLYSALVGRRDLSQAVHHWAVRDKDAAWGMLSKHLMEERGNAHHFTSLLTGSITADGEVEAVKWTLARMQELPEDKRRECLRMLDAPQLLTSEGYAVILSTASTADRQALAAASIGRSSGTETTFRLLDSLPRQELIAALEEGVRGNRGVLQGDPKEQYVARVQSRFREATSRYNMTKEEMARIYDLNE